MRLRLRLRCLPSPSPRAAHTFRHSRVSPHSVLRGRRGSTFCLCLTLTRLEDHERQIAELQKLTAEGGPPKTAAFALANLNKGLSEGYLTSALHRAARAGDAASLEALLRDDSKKAVNRRDEIGWQPLLHAACVGQRLSVQLPLELTAPRDNATRTLILEEVCELLRQCEPPVVPPVVPQAGSAPAGGPASGAPPAAEVLDPEEWGVWVEVRWAKASATVPRGGMVSYTHAPGFRDKPAEGAAAAPMIEMVEVELVQLHANPNPDPDPDPNPNLNPNPNPNPNPDPNP